MIQKFIIESFTFSMNDLNFYNRIMKIFSYIKNFFYKEDKIEKRVNYVKVSPQTFVFNTPILKNTIERNYPIKEDYDYLLEILNKANEFTYCCERDKMIVFQFSVDNKRYECLLLHQYLSFKNFYTQVVVNFYLKNIKLNFPILYDKLIEITNNMK